MLIKKMLISVCSACLVMASTVGAAASPAKESNIGLYDSSFLSSATLDELQAYAVTVFDTNADYYRSIYPSAEEIREDWEVLHPAQSRVGINYNDFDDSTYLEYVLDKSEGIGLQDFYAAYTDSQDALNIARRLYPQGADGGIQDSYRHFSWNFMMTQHISKQKARVIGNNHEWGYRFMTMGNIQRYFDTHYQQYINAGYTDSQAKTKANDDTNAFIPFSKSLYVSVFKDSYTQFKNFWNDPSYYMDLWNNCYGRSYPEKGYTSYDKAFLDCTDQIISVESVNEDHMWCIWDWDWYGYAN